MIIFTCLLSKSIFQGSLKKRRDLMNANERKTFNKMRNLTKSLLFIAVSFLIMTLPATLAFGFFTDFYLYYKAIFILLDNLAFFYHSTLFLSCMLTNNKFRSIVLRKVLNKFSNSYSFGLTQRSNLNNSVVAKQTGS